MTGSDADGLARAPSDRESLSGLSLTKFGQRYYDKTGRRTQRAHSTNHFELHGWNGYIYAGDDPVNLTDLSGLSWTDWTHLRNCHGRWSKLNPTCKQAWSLGKLSAAWHSYKSQPPAFQRCERDAVIVGGIGAYAGGPTGLGVGALTGCVLGATNLDRAVLRTMWRGINPR